MNSAYRVSYQVLAKERTVAAYATTRNCERVLLAEDVEDAIKRVRESSPQPVTRISSVIFLATIDGPPGEKAER